MLGAIVDWEAILDVVVVSFGAGVGVTAVYAIAVFGVAHVVDAGRDGRTVAAGAYGALALVAFLVVIGACAAGIAALSE